jgi:transcriptional regulator with XRE-family HTH domain
MNRAQRDAMADPDIRRTFEEELLFGEATDTVAALLESIGITQRELANRLSVTEGRVSQILSGAENLTLRSLASLGWALGVRFELQPEPMEDRAGTPAQADPAPPSWLETKSPTPKFAFRTMSVPFEVRTWQSPPVLQPMSLPESGSTELAA